MKIAGNEEAGTGAPQADNRTDYPIGNATGRQSQRLRWFLVLTFLLLSLIIGMTLRANTVAPPRFPDSLIEPIVAYLVIATAMFVGFFLRFRAKPALLRG
jgi:hypothetical protein